MSQGSGRIHALPRAAVMPDPTALPLDEPAGSAERESESAAVRRFSDGPMELRVDLTARAIGLIAHASDAHGRQIQGVEDATQWPVFRCVSATKSTVHQVPWERALSGPTGRLLRTQWPRIRRIRRTLYAELPLELRGWIVRMRFPWLSFHDIERMWRSMDVVRQIVRDNVNPLALWLCLPMPANGNPVSRKSLRDKYGVSSAAWKALQRHGWRLFPTHVMHASVVARRIGAQAWLGLIGADRIDGVMRSDVKREVWCLAASAPAVFSKGGDLPRAALRHVREELAAGRPIDGASLACTIIDIDLHLDRFRPDPNQRRAGWHWWLRQWQALDVEAGEPARDEAWSCPVDSFTCGDIFVVPLHDTAALRDEGRRMRTCLATRSGEYADRCLKRGVRLYSLRHRSVDGSGKGTVALALDGFGRPFVEESAGHANRALPKRLAPVVDELLRRYHEAEAQLPLAQARRKRVAAFGRGGHGIGRTQANNADPRAIVSVAHAENELALAEIVRERVRQHVIVEGHSALLLARGGGPSTIGFQSSIPMHLPELRKQDVHDAAHSGRRIGDEPVCLIASVPDSITAMSVRSIVEQVETRHSPRAIVIDATGHDARQVADELEALAGFLGMPIHLVSMDSPALAAPVRARAALSDRDLA